MTAITFDTLKLAKRLQEAGMDREQAEAQAEALSEAMDSGIQDLATKQDLRLLEGHVDGRFTLLQWMLGFNLALSIAVLWVLFKLLSA